MSTGWDLDAGNTGSGSSDKVEYTKFPEGITRLRLVDDAPFQRWTHWMPKYQRSVTCPGGRECPICQIRKREKDNKITPQSYNVAKRFCMNVINRETGKLEIMEQGKMVFEDIRDLMDDLKRKELTLIEADLRFKRRGTTKDDTSYRVDIDEEYPLTDEDMKQLKFKVDFKEYLKPHTHDQILELVNFVGQSKDDYLNKWIEVNTDESKEEETKPETDEDIELA
jgi:hypothetical protein